MSTDLDRMPPHKPDCHGMQLSGPCEACRWLREQDLDWRAYWRFQTMFYRVPVDSYRASGMGTG